MCYVGELNVIDELSLAVLFQLYRDKFVGFMSALSGSRLFREQDKFEFYSNEVKITDNIHKLNKFILAVVKPMLDSKKLTTNSVILSFFIALKFQHFH